LAPGRAAPASAPRGSRGHRTDDADTATTTAKSLVGFSAREIIDADPKANAVVVDVAVSAKIRVIRVIRVGPPPAKPGAAAKEVFKTFTEFAPVWK
jgi:hypothetical protein